MKLYYMLKIINMGMEVICDKFNTDGMCINSLYAQKWITKLYKLLCVVLASINIQTETSEGK
jgi:hypothetical protein